jgi:hypothetical protein
MGPSPREGHRRCSGHKKSPSKTGGILLCRHYCRQKEHVTSKPHRQTRHDATLNNAASSYTTSVDSTPEGWLGVELGGCWVYGDPENPPAVLLPDRGLTVLLPLLAKPYPELASQLIAQENAPQLLSQLATFALRDRDVDDKWKQRANAWRADGCSSSPEV